ncbi:hypothetical protein O3Q52_19905 [Streptomyces sp. ActVer]|uniref:hypothetical protein n=1 Tax=Streptomyces sp. ActVer TaxID=3014558 RepID=UPI0022B2E910|nr:hypothetical protein [Streptomyces sp. ActVer]MCZ4510411.1 hypothetical protein [Streptomyces sp. ActVer]
MVDSIRIADLAQQHPDAIRNLEQRAIAEATRPLAQALTDAQATAGSRWIRETVGAQIPARLQEFVDWVRDLLRRAFAGKGQQAQHAAEIAAFNGAQLGSRQALAIAAAMGQRPQTPAPVQAGSDAQQAADAIPPAVQEEQGHALALLTTVSLTAMGFAGLTSAFTRARRAVGRIAAGMAVAVTSAVSYGASLVARALGDGVRLLWVAEPDACPACAAYAGLHIRPGGKFSGGLTLGPPRTAFPTAIAGPPRHIHCRCALIPWSPNWPVDGIPLPTLLRQRARTNRRP